MFDWFYRDSPRHGVDAALVRTNRKQLKFGLWSSGIGLVLIGLDGKLRGIPEDIVGFAAVFSLIVGFVVVLLASREYWFLRKSDPKKPPSLFK